MTKKIASQDSERAWGLFLLSHTLLLEHIEAALANAKLPPLAWYDVLWELEKADDGRLRMHELADRIVLSRSNLTRLADRLEKADLIIREHCPHDRRGNFCVITRTGKETRKKMWPVYRQQIESLYSRYFSATEARTLARNLEKVIQGLKSKSAS
jgi:DNA-binding MarR family transcriptional regulator